MKLHDEEIHLTIRLPDERELDHLTEIFSIFADSTRIRIICVLQEGALAVGEICAALEMSQPAISHQLRILKGARVVRARREGRNIYYSLDDSHVSAILQMGRLHVQEESDHE